MTCDASRSPFSGPGSMSIRMLTFARNSVVIGSTVAWESSESRFERTTTAGRALSRDNRTTTTVPRRMASGSTAILPFGPRAARNPPRSHLLPASRWQAGGTHRRGEPDSQDRLRPAATARPRAIRAHAGRSDGERSGRGRMRGFACVTRNASAAHLQGLPAGASSQGMPAITPFVRTIPSHWDRRRLFPVRGPTRAIMTAPWCNHVPANV